MAGWTMSTDREKLIRQAAEGRVLLNPAVAQTFMRELLAEVDALRKQVEDDDALLSDNWAPIAVSEMVP